MNDPTVNGHAVADEQSASAVDKFVIRNFRVEPGTVAFVRLLADFYGGLFTHYYRGRSTVCQGKDCQSLVHKVDRTWKGYCPAELYSESKKAWLPICLEITESLELDMRGIFARGQMWELWRELPPKKGATPVQGKLHPPQEWRNLPRPFDIIPCLRALFHTDFIDLGTKSPIPARVYQTASEGDTPAILVPKTIEAAAEDFGSVDEWRRKQREAAAQKVGKTKEKEAYKK